MLDKALLFLEREVNRYFDAHFGPSTQKWVTIGNVAKYAESESGSGMEESSARALLTLVNIEEDRIAKSPDNYFRTSEGIIYRNPEILLNLYVLFSAIGNSYSLALETVGLIIQCFQGVNVFDRSTHPDLDPSLEKLTLELYTLNFEQINHLWSTLGGKYLPSALYKLRLVGIEDTDRQVEGDLIREIIIRDERISRE